MQEELQTNNTIHLIKEQLKHEKNLFLLNEGQFKVGCDQLMKVKDNNDIEYSLLIIPLSNYHNNQGLISEQKLYESIKKAKTIKEVNHPNILKYYSDFQIGNYYFIQMEKFDLSLQDWINNRDTPVEKEIFITISIQILQVAEYLHLKNINLPDISLQNILINKDMSIKLFNVGFTRIVNCQFIQEKLQQSIENKELFYYKYQLIKSNSNQIRLKDEDDIWAIIICLYSMAGATNEQILNYLLYKENYRPQFHLGIEINTILLYLMWKKQGSTKLSSSTCLIQMFKNIQENVNNSEVDEGTNTDHLKTAMEEERETKCIPHTQEQFDSYMCSFEKGLQFFHDGLDDYYLALQCFKKCLELYPNSDILQFQLAKIQRIQKLNEEAIKSYEKALEINPKNEIASYNLGNIYKDQGQNLEAIARYEKSIEIYPKDDWAYNNLGVSYKKLSNYEKAIQCYKKVIEIAYEDESAFFNLGLAYKGTKNHSSILYNKKALKCNPQKAHSYYNMGFVQSQQLNYEKAIKYYKKLIKLLPQQLIIYENLLNEQKNFI